MPVTGCHSVIDRPDVVSRVMPPMTTMTKIMPQHRKSHAATAWELGPASLAASVGGWAIAVGRDNSVGRKCVPSSGNDRRAGRKQDRHPTQPGKGPRVTPAKAGCIF